MALDDKPWWGKQHNLWGGETFTSTETDPTLGIVKDDRFRVEKTGNNKATLVPHPQNVGTWKDSHSTTNPIQLTTKLGTQFERAYSMMVKITAAAAPKQLFFIERKNGSTAITDNLNNPGGGGGTASVER